ncbi:MAG: hypothetical protein LIO78_06820 [Clostridiales bacterium]|nr:hypothetical protein [Clostridiales bacterium]MCC8099759.1 hypothetical protein [Clostridiales bacterium]
MANNDIRQEINRAGVRMWQIADELHISQCTFSVKLRHELTPGQKNKIREAISTIQKTNELEEVNNEF